MGFTRRSVAESPVRSYRTISPLPETLRSIGGVFSVALSVPYGPTNYEAHCPVELGLSSLANQSDHPSACGLRRILRLPAKPLEQTDEVCRERTPKVKAFTGAGVDEFQLGGVQKVPARGSVLL